MGIQTRPTHVRPQTTAQARRAFTSHGPRISTQQSRQLARGAELYERSEKIKDAERRRKQNAKKKADKEERERDARRRMGIPSPMKAVGKVAASQGLLVGFVRVLERKEEVKSQHGEKYGIENEETEELEVADFGDDVLDDDSLLEAVEQKSESPKALPPVPIMLETRALQQAPKHAVTMATTSFTGSTDFVLARDITWTQDIEAARSFDSELIKSPTLTPEPQPPAMRPPVGQDCWDDMLWSNTQIEREIAITPPRPTLLFAKTLVPEMTPLTFHNAPPMQGARLMAEDDNSFLSMLSTQDLTFSSPELDRRSLSPPTKPVQSPNPAMTSRAVEAPVSANHATNTHLMPPPPRPAAKNTPQEQSRETAMLPPPRPAVRSPVQLPRPVAGKAMPPPPRPAYVHANVMPTPPRPLSRVPNPSHQTAVSARVYAPPKPSHAMFTAPRPQHPQHVHGQYSTIKPAVNHRIEPMTDWIASDFELSTQDCREIGVG